MTPMLSTKEKQKTDITAVHPTHLIISITTSPYSAGQGSGIMDTTCYSSSLLPSTTTNTDLSTLQYNV